MVVASKILTVSYGTFSCTLEGFDDPFSTMKAIAEYFRDLASEDRYFGAEPPTPDAEMLNRIAEREIQRRVETRFSETGIVLRAQEILAPEVAVAEPVAAAVVAPAAPEVAAEPAVLPDALEQVEEDAIAAKLARIRAAVSESQRLAAEVAELAPAEAMAEMTSGEPVSELTVALAADASEEPSPDTSPEIEAAVLEAVAEPEAEADESLLLSVLTAVSDQPEPVEVEPTQLIGAEPETDPALLAAASAPVPDDLSQRAQRRAARVARGLSLTAVTDAATEAELPAFKAALFEETRIDAPEIEEIAAEAPETVVADDLPEMPGDDALTADDAFAMQGADDLGLQILMPENDAEVAKVDAEVVQADPEAEAQDDAAQIAATIAALMPQSATAEPQAAPAVIAEAAPEDAVPDQAADAEPVLVLRPSRPVDAEPAEADLSRLLSETNSKLEGSESRRRFSAIAHLKAAVAATLAERRLGGAKPESEPESDLGNYRKDLSQAVRPRTAPVETKAATPRPARPEQRPAPLVLVSEQRIDRSGETLAPATALIRPRRVSAAMLAHPAAPTIVAMDDDDDDTPLSPAEAKNFADFAESLGASGLADLLEAAAAYTSSVEGRPHFSRPQIIKKVVAVAQDNGYSREDGLRSFGMLLRQGKIAKVKRGQFAITSASRFYTKARRA